ncbi:MAG TPA: hypothetical protein PLG31_14305 [Spirochaetota bacterium]|nr:hypothetical protein [Spirochaetota bacterium]
MKQLIKRHRIKVTEGQSNGLLETAASGLVRMLGVNDIDVDRKTGTIDITYDLAHTSYRALERKLGELGCATASSPLQSIKRALINFTEQNQIVSRHLETVNPEAARRTRARR